MVCLYCGHTTRVTNSRAQQRQNTIWRRRVCGNCNNVFTTRELPVLSQSILVRGSSKKLEPFSRDRLFLSIFGVCKHRAHAISESAALTETVMSIILKKLQNSMLEKCALVEVTQEVLGRFDSIAASLYGSYHPLKR